MQAARPNLYVDHIGYFFIILLGVALLGFWPTYFSKFFDGTARVSHYFHLHAAFASLWLVVLILQPILIRKKKLLAHRTIGRLTYVLFPLVCITILLMVHSRYATLEEGLGLRLLIPFKDLLVFMVAYIVAICYRHQYHLHARAMIATGLVFIEPSLVRLISQTVTGFPMAYYLTIAIIYLLIGSLIVAERKQKKARWVFPLLLLWLMLAHTVLIFEIQLPPWEKFAQWFIQLPLT